MICKMLVVKVAQSYPTLCNSIGHLMQTKNWLTGKDPEAGKDWRLKEKREAEDEMVEWRHGLNGHESEQTPGDSERQGSLVSIGCKESDTT